jgi:hypothetical protein
MGTTSASARKRWRRRNERERMAEIIRARYRPTSGLLSEWPAEVQKFLEVLKSADCELVDCVRAMTPRRTECYSVTVVDCLEGDWADIDAAENRYIKLAAQVPLGIFAIDVRPFPKMGRVVALIVGKLREQEGVTK